MIVYAVNVHSGGGKVLLDEVLEKQPFGPVSAAFLDTRYSPNKSDSSFKIFSFKKGIISRLSAEIQLHIYLRRAFPEESVLFFGNIPPFFKPRNKSFLYLQNCFLTRQVPLPPDSIKLKIRNWVESLLLKFFAKNVDEIWVQTSWMKKITEVFVPRSQVMIRPFLPSFLEVEKKAIRSIDIIYVGSKSLHKRLDFFMAALMLLDAKTKTKLKVMIVLDGSSVGVNPPQLNNIEIILKSQVSRQDLYQLYADSKVFVATSLYESFCLPIYEAQHYSCHLIGPVAGYTDDISNIVRYQIDSVTDLTEKILTSLGKD